VSLLVPLAEVLIDPVPQVLQRVKVRNPHPLFLKRAEPLFDLIHPRTVHGRQVKDKSRMILEPGLHGPAVVGRTVVQNHVNRGHRGRDRLVQVVQKGDEFLVAFALEGLPDDLAGAGIEGDNRFKAPARRYCGSRRLGIFSGPAARVGGFRGRG